MALALLPCQAARKPVPATDQRPEPSLIGFVGASSRPVSRARDQAKSDIWLHDGLLMIGHWINDDSWIVERESSRREMLLRVIDQPSVRQLRQAALKRRLFLPARLPMADTPILMLDGAAPNRFPVDLFD